MLFALLIVLLKYAVAHVIVLARLFVYATAYSVKCVSDTLPYKCHCPPCCCYYYHRYHCNYCEIFVARVDCVAMTSVRHVGWMWSTGVGHRHRTVSKHNLTEVSWGQPCGIIDGIRFVRYQRANHAGTRWTCHWRVCPVTSNTVTSSLDQYHDTPMTFSHFGNSSASWPLRFVRGLNHRPEPDYPDHTHRCHFVRCALRRVHCESNQVGMWYVRRTLHRDVDQHWLVCCYSCSCPHLSLSCFVVIFSTRCVIYAFMHSSRSVWLLIARLSTS